MKPGQENCTCLRCSWGKCCICGVNVTAQIEKHGGYNYLPGACRKVSESYKKGEVIVEILSSLCPKHRDSV